MTGNPGDHPLPHSGLHAQAPLLFVLRAGAVVYRHHRSDQSPVFFGKTGNYRFDDPRCPDKTSFGVLYTGEDPHCCFIESCGSTTGQPTVSGAYLAAREIAILELTEELRFIDLASSGGLTHVGADGRLLTGSYTVAQHWSAALRTHPSRPDGIRYLARHDPTRVAYAIFERPRSTFKIGSMGTLMAPANRALLNSILSGYNVALI